MTRFVAEQWLPVELPTVFAFFCEPENLPRIMPEELKVRIGWARLQPPQGAGELLAGLEPGRAAGAGSEFLFYFRPLPPLPVEMGWQARIEEFEAGVFFRDVQLKGPMRRWSHRHEFRAGQSAGVEGTVVGDRVEFELGWGWPGKLAERYFVLPALRASFARRQQAVEQALRGSINGKRDRTH
jgi:ligand-binding SRPBCC domain-containing protein